MCFVTDTFAIGNLCKYSTAERIIPYTYNLQLLPMNWADKLAFSIIICLNLVIAITNQNAAHKNRVQMGFVAELKCGAAPNKKNPPRILL